MYDEKMNETTRGNRGGKKEKGNRRKGEDMR
jgi:hypothetical protein